MIYLLLSNMITAISIEGSSKRKRGYGLEEVEKDGREEVETVKKIQRTDMSRGYDTHFISGMLLHQLLLCLGYYTIWSQSLWIL